MEEDQENKNLEENEGSESPQESINSPVQESTPEVQEEDSEEKVTLSSHAIRYGVILGLAGIIFTVIVYIISPPMLGNPWMGLLLIVYFIYLVYAGINYRKQIGGFIDFGKAFQHAFLLLVISAVIGTIFQMLLYSIIDPTLPEVIGDAASETARSMASRFGAPEDAIADAVEKARTDTIARLTVVGLIKGFGFGLIGYAIASAISGLIVRKREPEGDIA